MIDTTERSQTISRLRDNMRREGLVDDFMGIEGRNSLPSPFIRFAASRLLGLEAGLLTEEQVRLALAAVDLDTRFHINNPVEMSES